MTNTLGLDKALRSIMSAAYRVKTATSFLLVAALVIIALFDHDALGNTILAFLKGLNLHAQAVYFLVVPLPLLVVSIRNRKRFAALIRKIRTEAYGEKG